jgi:hypothetical protein
MYAIRRHKAAINAWYWVASFRRNGKLHTKQFHDAKYGGSTFAKAKAIAWRDKALASVRALTVRDFHKQVRSNNVSGVAGVHFHQTPAQPLGFWQAAIRHHDGTRITRSFSVRKFGNDEAFRRATAARDELLSAVKDRPYLKSATAKRLSKQA